MNKLLTMGRNFEALASEPEPEDDQALAERQGHLWSIAGAASEIAAASPEGIRAKASMLRWMIGDAGENSQIAEMALSLCADILRAKT